MKIPALLILPFLLCCALLPLSADDMPSGAPDYYSEPYHHYEPAFSRYPNETKLVFAPPFETVEVGGYFEIDGNFFFGEDQPKQEFLVQLARFFFMGELFDTFSYLFMPEYTTLGGGRMAFVWLETLYPYWGRLRVGLFKEPFSLEALRTPLDRTFTNLSLVVRNYVIVKDVGVMCYGHAFDRQLTYAVACMNGREIDDPDKDVGNPEVVGRITVELPTPASIGQFYVSGAVAVAQADTDLSGKAFFTETNNRFWEWNDDPYFPVLNKDTRFRWEVDFEWLSGPFYLCAEYIHTDWGKVKMHNRSAPFSGQGGYIQCSYLLTGEDKPRNGGVVPFRNFDRCKGGWGAFEVGLKYEAFSASKKMIELGFARGANLLHGPTAVLNWYLNPRIAFKMDAQYLWFNRPFVSDSRTFKREIDLVCRLQALF